MSSAPPPPPPGIGFRVVCVSSTRIDSSISSEAPNPINPPTRSSALQDLLDLLADAALAHSSDVTAWLNVPVHGATDGALALTHALLRRIGPGAAAAEIAAGTAAAAQAAGLPADAAWLPHPARLLLGAVTHLAAALADDVARLRGPVASGHAALAGLEGGGGGGQQWSPPPHPALRRLGLFTLAQSVVLRRLPPQGAWEAHSDTGDAVATAADADAAAAALLAHRDAAHLVAPVAYARALSSPRAGSDAGGGGVGEENAAPAARPLSGHKRQRAHDDGDASAARYAAGRDWSSWPGRRAAEGDGAADGDGLGGAAASGSGRVVRSRSDGGT